MEGRLYKAVKVRRLVDDLRADPNPSRSLNIFLEKLNVFLKNKPLSVCSTGAAHRLL